MEQAAAHDPLLGASVGNYQVERKLGEGGMGAVYLAVHPQIGKKVALKVLHPEFSSNDEVVGRFFNEAKAVNDIQHPNIVDIIDYGTMPSPAGGQPVVYFIMEYLGGESLAKIIAEQAPLAPERAQAIALQIADALAASHRNGVVHRDLKPDNVMLIPRRHNRDFVKVLDFGIAKLTGDQQGSRRTRTGVVMGTPAYMSPEQCEGRGHIDQRTDIYSLGILLYEMLTGKVPFQGEGYGEVLVQHMTQVPLKPSTHRGLIPPHLEAVCMKALEKRPESRFSSMEEFMKALTDPVSYVESHGGVEGFLSYGLGTPAPGLMPGMTPVPGMTPTPYPVLGHGTYGTPMGQNPIAPLTPAPYGMPPGYHAAPVQRRSAVPMLAIVAVGAVALGVGGFFGLRALHGKAQAPAADKGAAASGAHGGTPMASGGAEGDPDSGQDTGDTGDTRDSSDTGGSSAKAAGTGSAAGHESAETTPAPAQVNIVVSTTPRGAQVFFGDEPTPRGVTPYSFELDRGTAPVTLVLKADGYQDRTESLVPSENRTLDLQLAPVEKTPPPSHHSSSGGHHGSGGHHHGSHGSQPSHAGDNTLKPSF